jgi:NAD(P)-dependent dehydrogenase (short-subunit alcohol dehydrogenase family)
LSPSSFEGRIVVVTGVTSGIGRATASEFLVNVSSRVCTVIGERPPYAAAKAGIVGLTRAHARLLGPHGVRVNCVAPGVIETAAWGERGVGDEWIRLVPLCRCGYPPGVARVIVFLASDEAAYVSGACLVVDGGLSTALGPEPHPIDDVG